jgi:shikimate kinase
VIVLIGPMGSGKTTVGGLVAERLGTAVRDTDHDVEETAGRAISEIFVDDGEAAFRALERAAVAAALATHDGVLALGGGAVLDPETRELLAGHDVVFLRVGLSDAVKRVGLGTSRPLLLGNVRGRIKTLLDERTPVYESVATLTVETDGRDPQEIADEIVAALGARARARPSSGSPARRRTTSSSATASPTGCPPCSATASPVWRSCTPRAWSPTTSSRRSSATTTSSASRFLTGSVPRRPPSPPDAGRSSARPDSPDPTRS